MCGGGGGDVENAGQDDHPNAKRVVAAIEAAADPAANQAFSTARAV